MKIPVAAAALLTSVAMGAADQAAAATTDIGAVGEIREATPPTPTAPGGFVVQVAEATGTYAVPPGYGTITSWRHSAGGAAGTLTFRVYRPTGPLREFRVVAADTRSVTAGSVQSFRVQIPVLPGDRIGLSSEDLELVYETFDPADMLGFFEPDPPVGTIKATDGTPFEEFKLDVAATLESAPDAPGAGPTLPGGSLPGATPLPGFPKAAPPAVTRLRIAPSTFAAARSGPSVTFSPTSGARVGFSAAARTAVRFTVARSRPGRRRGSGRTARCVSATKANRAAPPCRRTTSLPGSFTRPARAGANSFRFTGRMAGRALKPGAYTLVATAQSGDASGKPATARFRIGR